MTLGARVRDYEVWGRLGEGGMSEVWLAKHRVLAVPVVMKTLRAAALGIDPADCAKRVFNEARLMARVTSPRVVRAVDAGIAEDEASTPYLVEEYVDGIDLCELDRRRRRALGVGLPLWFVAYVAEETSEALRAAHQVGVLHRDLKPSNVFAAPGTGIRLGDFGLAVAHADAPHGDTSGTLRFMAPEQLRGDAMTRASDVYGLAATIYDLRYGHPPFVSTRDAMDPDRTPSFPAPHSPAEAYLQHVLQRMLVKDATRRPHDASEPARHFASLGASLRPMHARVPFTPLGRDAFRLGEVELTLGVGDIADAEADAIASSANDRLEMRSGTGEALRRRGGDAIEVEAMTHGRQPLGACLATAAGSLAARHVIHAVSAWNETSCIGRTMSRVLLVADELGHRSLALPALGTGAARVGIETCARAMTSGLAWHLALGGTRLKKVQLVLGSEAKMRVFREVLEDVLHDGLDEPLGDLGMPVDDVRVEPDGATHLDARSKR
jgi:serine/threonine-protein kinase